MTIFVIIRRSHSFTFSAFTRGSSGSLTDLDAGLEGWMRFYNFEPPHGGYRTKGRRPPRSSTRTDPICSR